MKTNIKYLFIAIGVYALAFVISCGKKEEGAPVVNPGIGVVATCPAGFVQQGNICYNPTTGQQIPLTGFTNQIEYIAANFTANNLQITNSAVYKDMLKNAMGVCDRTNSATGVYDCDSWVNGYVSVYVQDIGNNNMKMTITHFGPVGTNFFNGFFGFDTGGFVFNPLTLNMTVSPINNSLGFEARSYGLQGSTAWNVLFQFQVAQGRLGDAGFGYQIAFRGQVFATGTMKRCTSQGCSNW